MYVLLKTTCAIALELYTAYVLPYMVTVRFHSCRTRITAVQAIEIENTTYTYTICLVVVLLPIKLLRSMLFYYLKLSYCSFMAIQPFIDP